MSSAKPFVITKRLEWEAYQRVKANRGAAVIDGQSIDDFDRDRSRNLYRIWNRMSSGSYFWLLAFIEHRIADRRILRQVSQWLKVGVLDGTERTELETGTPQGGNISPLLANVYLYYAFDLWIDQWRRRLARGDVIVVRYADDFVVGFQRKSEAEQFQAMLVERFGKFSLQLHADKTRMSECGRYAAERRALRGVDTTVSRASQSVRTPVKYFALGRGSHRGPRRLSSKLRRNSV